METEFIGLFHLGGEGPVNRVLLWRPSPLAWFQLGGDWWRSRVEEFLWGSSSLASACGVKFL